MKRAPCYVKRALWKEPYAISTEPCTKRRANSMTASILGHWAWPPPRGGASDSAIIRRDSRVSSWDFEQSLSSWVLDDSGSWWDVDDALSSWDLDGALRWWGVDDSGVSWCNLDDWMSSWGLDDSCSWWDVNDALSWWDVDLWYSWGVDDSLSSCDSKLTRVASSVCVFVCVCVREREYVQRQYIGSYRLCVHMCV